MSSLPKQDPFMVPHGFFERFPQTMLERVAERPSFIQRLLAPIMMPRKTPLLAFGSVIAVLGLGLGLVFWLQEPTKEASANLTATQYPFLEPTDWQDAELLTLMDEASELWMGVGNEISTTELEVFVETEDLDLELLNELL